MLTMELWIALFVAMGALVVLRAVWGKKRVKIQRMNESTLKTARKLVVPVLKLVEDGHDSLLDSNYLPSSKANVKNAAKVLAYYYWKTKQPVELKRITAGFVGISRFQDKAINDETREKVRKREQERFQQEIDQYMAGLH